MCQRWLRKNCQEELQIEKKVSSGKTKDVVAEDSKCLLKTRNWEKAARNKESGGGNWWKAVTANWIEYMPH